MRNARTSETSIVETCSVNYRFPPMVTEETALDAKTSQWNPRNLLIRDIRDIFGVSTRKPSSKPRRTQYHTIDSISQRTSRECKRSSAEQNNLIAVHIGRSRFIKMMIVVFSKHLITEGSPEMYTKVSQHTQESFLHRHLMDASRVEQNSKWEYLLTSEFENQHRAQMVCQVSDKTPARAREIPS